MEYDTHHVRHAWYWELNVHAKSKANSLCSGTSRHHTLCVQVSGNIMYNGHALDEFVPERTATFVNQVSHRL